jgi:hypothetical protein
MRPCSIVFSLLILAVPMTANVAENSSENFVAHGTINVVLANENGLVILTDSMITEGSHQIPNPGQKLFRLDDRTVCTIAGFVYAGAPVPELYTSTSAIVDEFRKQLATRPPQSIDAKLGALAFLFNFYLSAIANVRDSASIATPIGSYAFELIIAGYDTDDLPKVGKITLRSNGASGGPIVSETQDISLVKVEKRLMWRLGGQPDVAEMLLQVPRSAMGEPVFDLLANSLQKDGGQSLTVQQIKEVAIKLAYYTSKTYPSVGGANQIAILQMGHIVKIVQATFPDPPKLLVNFGLIVNNQIDGQNALILKEGISGLFIRCVLSRMERQLDRNFFFANDFRDAVLTYDGGILYFDKSNVVSNTVLVIGRHANRHDPRVLRLTNDFSWSQIVYQQPRLQP